jgi:hypothetical protein
MRGTSRIFVMFAFCRAAANSGPATITLTAVDESPVGLLGLLTRADEVIE